MIKKGEIWLVEIPSTNGHKQSKNDYFPEGILKDFNSSN